MDRAPLATLTARSVLERHDRLLRDRDGAYSDNLDRLISSPFFSLQSFTHSIRATVRAPLQYGLMARMFQDDTGRSETAILQPKGPDQRLFFNVTAPSSIFICGSQGSGKSHTLSCLLENCLTSSDAAELPKPLSVILLHYDTFISDDGGSPCEAAFLSSLPGIRVRVVCAPTNISTIRKTYEHLAVDVEPLQIDDSDLNTKRILDLMAIKSEEGSIPLYIHTVNRILREMRLSQQATGVPFDYQTFKSEILAADLTSSQLAPLNQRLASLESFMPRMTNSAKGKRRQSSKGTSWENKPGLLTIIDLSCPCISPETACSLFNICLSLFLEQRIDCGRVVALDEAHKYMTGSPESLVLTNSLLATVRLQRHLGLRVFVSTQEPTIAPAFLDLCSVSIIHRFSSPAWMYALAAHIAVVQQQGLDADERQEIRVNRSKETNYELFQKIVRLRTGEALLFAASAMPELGEFCRLTSKESYRSYVKIKVRARLSADGGKSSFAN